MNLIKSTILLGAVALALSACDSGGSASGTPSASTPLGTTSGSSSPSTGGGTSGGSTATPSGPSSKHSYTTAVLIYNGSGAWTDEVTSLESIMTSHSTAYTEVTDTQLNGMTEAQLATYGMILFPGGSGTDMLDALQDATRTNIMNAVRDDGVGYLGFCAGAFMGVSPAPASGQAPAYFSIIQAPEENYYELENQGVDEAMTLESFPDGSTRNILWYGGPVTPDIAGGVIAKYPTGDPAMTESVAGNGFAIVSGVHPAATLVDIEAVGGTSTSFDIAWELINAVLTQTPLPAFSS